jgi:hypothetical protein
MKMEKMNNLHAKNLLSHLELELGYDLEKGAYEYGTDT